MTAFDCDSEYVLIIVKLVPSANSDEVVELFDRAKLYPALDMIIVTAAQLPGSYKKKCCRKYEQQRWR